MVFKGDEGLTLCHTLYPFVDFQSASDAGKMSSWLHATNLMFVFVATFRKYLGSFVEEVFLISFHYTQFFFEAEIAPLCTAFIGTCAF